MTRTKLMARMLTALAVTITAGSAQAVMISFSNLETVLADPDDKDSMMTALWTGWATQLYEYNMPFVELVNDADAPSAIEEFRMSIGDTDYQFSNEFLRKEDTNSYPYEANGEYAITGYSTPDIDFTTSVEQDGDILVIDFGPDGLAPGETVRFQVDINGDNSEMMVFADYLSVFMTPNGGDDTSNNSVIEVTYVDPEITADPLTLPNFTVSSDVVSFLQSPRPYSTMQPIDVFPGTTIDPIPEPTAGLLALLAAASFATRRRG